MIGALRSPETKSSYTFRLVAFLSYMRVDTPEELLRFDQKTTERRIIEYIIHLKDEKKLSYSSLQGVCAPLRKFYAMNDVTLNWEKIHNYLGAHDKTIEDKAYTKEQIRKLLQFASQRTRILILLLASSGLRIGAVSGLRYKHLKYIEKYGIYQITIYPKAKERYVTYCTPECTAEINNYFEYRQRCGEVLNEQSPLIREDFDGKDIHQVKNPRAASTVALKFLLERVVKNAGLKMRHERNDDGMLTQRTEIMRAHGLRKFFDTNLVRAVVHAIKIEALMGHKRGIQSSYFRPSDDELLEEYVKAIELLTINEENRLKIKVEELTAQNESNDDVIKNRLQEKEKEMEELRRNDKVKEDALATLSDQVMKLMVEVQELKKQK
jgi:integrase